MNLRRRRRLKLVLRLAAAIAITAFFLFPIYWLFMISFKTPEEIFAFPPKWWPAQLQFDNYQVLFKDGDANTVGNSLVVASVSTVFAMFLGTLCAYSLARFRTGGENLANWIISQRMVPPIAVVFPIFLLYVWLKLVDTYVGLILLYTAFNLPFTIWMLRSFFLEVPQETQEAAMIDGCTWFGVLVRVILPLSAPGIAVTVILGFMFCWNAFNYPLMLAGRQSFPFTVGAIQFISYEQVLWGQMAAATIVAALPQLLLSLMVQKYIVRGLTMGAVR